MKSDNTPAQLLQQIAQRMDEFPPELRKAATYLLENRNAIGVGSIHAIAQAADVKANTLVRLSRQLGFDGYEAFRSPFRENILQGKDNFPDRARWLQSLAKGGETARIYSEMAATMLGNIERTYSGARPADIKRAADAIVRSRRTYVLGVGISHSVATNFAYLANMALDKVQALPSAGGVPLDGLVRADSKDVLLAMTFKPYRREVVEAVDVALEQGLTVIAISDSAAAPIVRRAQHAFVVPTDTPQFFPSIVAAAAFMETLMAFVIADADPQAIRNIEQFHERRHGMGIYWDEKG